MRFFLPLGIAALTFTLTLATPAVACSVTADYRAPTNLELAADAELILLGRVVDEAAGVKPWHTSLRVAPVLAVKGTMPDSAVWITGVGLLHPGERRSVTLSNPYELAEPHPESLSGACIRRAFPAGTTALFFLERAPDGEGWRPSGRPFSRWAEDVLVEDAPWLRLTRFYAEVAAAPEGERTALLEAERARLAALAEDPVAQLMAADIARQIEGPNPTGHEVMRREIEDE
ncbi:hypothetical protein [Altererythrobacter sp. C41]|uniref:hypothetical protein n=1 Tax=Altererythrobacter sp. C41 TaxID=2806021 RepID=UPI0019348996|nr:hypothetical protein [Altererythrobacter sp. C41]MBM0169427.1 hypothetical protein [Altererythrobacter sp. C41]